MASYVGLLSNATDGLQKIRDQLVSAGWTEIASVASTSTTVDGSYRVLKSVSGACHLLLHIRNVGTPVNKYIVVQCFETWDTVAKKIQHWVPAATTASIDLSGRVDLAAITCDEAFLATNSVGTASLACGPVASQYQLVVVAGAEHLICAAEQYGGSAEKRSLYAGAYKPYSWNTKSGSITLVNGLQKGTKLISHPPKPPSTATTAPSATHGAALTREYWPGAWKTSSTTDLNFSGSWVPLKAALGATTYPNTMDGFDGTRIMALEVLIYKRSTIASATILREVLLGTYFDLVDLDGADVNRIGNSVEVGGITYYNVTAGTGTYEGTIFVKA